MHRADPREEPRAARIIVIGVGGGGGNVVDRMLHASVRGVEFATLNTDAQALAQSKAPTRIQIGAGLTRGRGAGGDPATGEKAAATDAEMIRELVHGADLVFVTAGLGGGTGTGAAPVVAEEARAAGALTVAVVTRPFSFEGARRRTNADAGLLRLQACAHTLIAISNDRLLRTAGPGTSVEGAFGLADDVLHQGVQGISELITEPGLVNLDFADVRAVMSEPGGALLAIGRGAGEGGALEAARAALASPLLDTSVAGARGILLNVSGGSDLPLGDISEAAELIANAADPEANVIFGAVVQPSLGEEVRLTLIATGLELDTLRDPADLASADGTGAGRHSPAPRWA